MAINTHPRRGYLLHANQGLAPAQPDLKASAGSTGGQLTIFHALAQRRHAKAHAHPRGREHLPVLRGGRLEVECDGEEFEATSGSFVFLPRERPHTFRSVSGTAHGLLIVTPGGLENYFDALHAAIKTGRDSPQVMTVMAEYGIRPS